MQDEVNYLLLQAIGITKTDTRTIHVKQTLVSGIEIGQGGCKAIKLHLNTRVRNTDNLITATYFYWGDAQKQENEVLRGEDSVYIFCENQEEVFVRNAFAGVIDIQVTVYR